MKIYLDVAMSSSIRRKRDELPDDVPDASGARRNRWKIWKPSHTNPLHSFVTTDGYWPPHLRFRRDIYELLFDAENS